MLDTTQTTLADAIEELDGTIEERAAEMAELDPSTQDFLARARTANDYQQMVYGLEWARDKWGPDAEVAVGAPTAGEQALMHEQSQDHAGEERMRLWFAAAATEDAPWAESGLKPTFENIADVHGGLIDWIEWKANSLGRPEGSEGNRLRQYYRAAATQDQETSDQSNISTTSSSSDSGTA
jgi:hypothetical protein